MKKNSRLVYSTETGRIAPEKVAPPAPAGDGIVRLGRETKGRNGKAVTVATGFALDEGRLRQLAKKLKQICGTGGTAKDGRIEIQGDQRDKILVYLENAGFKVKKSGG